jgi:hypothetical protein
MSIKEIESTSMAQNNATTFLAHSHCEKRERRKKERLSIDANLWRKHFSLSRVGGGAQRSSILAAQNKIIRRQVNKSRQRVIYRVAEQATQHCNKISFLFNCYCTCAWMQAGWLCSARKILYRHQGSFVQLLFYCYRLEHADNRPLSKQTAGRLAIYILGHVL